MPSTPDGQEIAGLARKGFAAILEATHKKPPPLRVRLCLQRLRLQRLREQPQRVRVMRWRSRQKLQIISSKGVA
ncbi:MAG TPA: hypothetical protein V6D16_04120, partial [Candidatus Obscuribacterales bacterium]